MSYLTSAQKYVDSVSLDLDSTVGNSFTSAATSYSPVYELAERRNVTAALTVSAVSTSDTADVTIETSDDGTNYWTICTFAQVTDATSLATVRMSCSAAGRYLRAKYVVAGASAVLIGLALSAEAV